MPNDTLEGPPSPWTLFTIYEGNLLYHPRPDRSKSVRDRGQQLGGNQVGSFGMGKLEIVFWALAALIAYIYVGYPLLLFLWSRSRSKPIAIGESEPAITLLISAFNEEDVIAKKLENSLNLEYPTDRFEILVVSDASDDSTDEIVKSYAAHGVKLLRMDERGGKTLGLNAGVTAAAGEVIVFSDANAMYQADALRKLARNFADKEVGAVVGESTYERSANDADRSESAYWRYETAIKRLETRLGSVVGGDGAIYAIRKALYEPMPPDAISDFTNPLQIIAKRYRCVYDPDAISIESTAGSFDKEFRRKVRIVNRAWRATMSMKSMLNPWRYGIFSWQLLSHKVLRWLVPFLLAAALVANIFLAFEQSFYIVTLVLQLAFYALAIAGACISNDDLPAVLYMPFYFCMVNLASAHGVIEAYLGRTYTTWTPTRAEH